VAGSSSKIAANLNVPEAGHRQKMGQFPREQHTQARFWVAVPTPAVGPGHLLDEDLSRLVDLVANGSPSVRGAETDAPFEGGTADGRRERSR
jgi:hypothetical protein